jgi:predicted nucleic acid-binding protein
MSRLIDSSVIVAALIANQRSHDEYRALLLGGTALLAYTHVFAEVFNTLTGSRLGFRVPATDAARMLREQVLPRITVVALSAEEMLDAASQAEPRGVRGGAIFDFLHLVAASKAGAEKLCTLDGNDFLQFHLPGDPEIVHP